MKDLKAIINLKNIAVFNYGGINSDFKESFLMAVMGYTCYKKIPNNMKSVTGAKKTAVYGEIYE